MKRVLNWLLLISFIMILILGGLLYRSYRKSQVTDTTLLELNTSLYQNPIQLKDGMVEDTGINFIFYTSEDGQTLKEVVIEVLACKEGQLTYITVPGNTEIAVGAKLYQKLTAIYPEMPQYFQLSRLAGLFDDEKRYAYGQLILDDMFSIDSSYYSVIASDSNDFEEYKKAIILQYGMSETEQIKGYIKTEYSKISSNLSKKNKLQYAEYYTKALQNEVVTVEAEGVEHTDSYEIDLAQFAIQMAAAKNSE